MSDSPVKLRRGDHFLTIDDLAERWGISPATLYRWRSDGADMPPAVRIGNRVRYRLAAVEAWEAAREGSAA